MNSAKPFITLLFVGALAVPAMAQRTSGAESGLLGVKLFDPSRRVIALYGTPDQIQPVGAAVSAGGGGGAPSGPGGFRPGGGAGAGAAPAPTPPPPGNRVGPFEFGTDIIRQAGVAPEDGGPGGPSGPPAPRGGRGGFGAPGGAPGGGGGASGSGTTVSMVRWIYNRNGSKYGFVINNLGNVVQIEAIGLANRNVRTRQKVGFGATLATLVRAYGNPDGYEINGDNVLVKYLSRKKVAFRLSRLGPKKPQVVTGIVVSAAKA